MSLSLKLFFNNSVNFSNLAFGDIFKKVGKNLISSLEFLLKLSDF